MIIAATRYGTVRNRGRAPAVTTDTGYFAPTAYVDPETGDWELVFLGNWSGTFDRDVDVDVFAVGGGQQGGAGEGHDGSATGGVGGRGGGVVTRLNFPLTKETPYSVSIGQSGTSSNAFGITADTAAGAAGGTDNSKNGGSGSLAFGRQDAADRTLYEKRLNATIYFGAGGGFGGSTTYGDTRAPGTGGASGGGAGAVVNGDVQNAGSNGAANTGGGGGGGGAYGWAQYGVTSPGLGGSGIVIIRNVRESS